MNDDGMVIVMFMLMVIVGIACLTYAGLHVQF